MCHFITLILPANDVDAVRMVMERHGRAASTIDNPSIRKVLQASERQYRTTCGHCDCGTVLVPRHDTPEGIAGKRAKQVSRWRRKRWSDVKIARVMDEQRKADARPHGREVDSFELWTAVLKDIRDDLRLPYAGLFVRSYFGALDTETFEATRRELRKTVPHREALGSIEQSEVTIFPLT